jgi:hypothetical protein
MIPKSSGALPLSDGAIRAFKRELEAPPVPRVTLEPESLAAMDVSPASSEDTPSGIAKRVAVDPSAAGGPATAMARRRRSGGAVAICAALALAAALVALAAALVALAAALVALARYFVH